MFFRLSFFFWFCSWRMACRVFKYEIHTHAHPFTHPYTVYHILVHAQREFYDLHTDSFSCCVYVVSFFSSCHKAVKNNNTARRQPFFVFFLFLHYFSALRFWIVFFLCVNNKICWRLRRWTIFEGKTTTPILTTMQSMWIWYAYAENKIKPNDLMVIFNSNWFHYVVFYWLSNFVCACAIFFPCENKNKKKISLRLAFGIHTHTHTH